jgi:uncharacterized protein (DUF427 family)
LLAETDAEAARVRTDDKIAVQRAAGYEVGTGAGGDMPKAVWNGQVVAQSDRCEVVEGNQYFPPDAVRRDLLRESAKHTTCGWKGVASYYDVVVDGQTNQDAAWYYPDPKPDAKNIAGYIAFWRGVKIEP